MPGYRELNIPGPLSAATITRGGELQLWPDPPDEAAVLVTSPVGLGVHDKFDGAFDPNERCFDYTAGFMILVAAGVKMEAVTRSLNQDKPVEISLAAAMQDPEIVIPMIRGVQLPELFGMIAKADAKSFHQRFANFYNGGNPKPGLWESLKLTTEEAGLARSLGLLNWWDVTSGYRARLKGMIKMDESPIPSMSGSTGFRPAEQALGYIMSVDANFVRGQRQSDRGDNSVSGSPMTRERLERLMAVQYAEIIRERREAGRPADLGRDLAQVLFGQADEDQIIAMTDNPEMLKIYGLRTTLTALWAEYTRQQSEARTVYPDGQHDVDVPREIIELEGLHAVLEAEAILELSSREARELGLFMLVSTIAGMSVIQRGRKPDRTAKGADAMQGIDPADYSEADFQQDIIIAATVHRIIQNLGKTDELALFEKVMADGIIAKLEQRANQLAGGIEVTSAMRRQSSLAVAAGDYELMAAGLLQKFGSDGPVGAAGGHLEGWYRHLLANSASRETDTDGRYEEARRRLMQAIGNERRQEDFPGLGRMFCYYGDVRVEDGALGLLEAIVATNGAFMHIDSAGNSQHNPMTDKQTRADLQEIAGNRSYSLEIHAPFDTIPARYKCEAANFIGRMPRFFTARHILSVIIDNGYATLGVESNTQLVAQIKRDGSARFAEVPTQIVRLFRDQDGLLDFKLGHNHPNWKWQEHTLVIFRNKKDGSPSDLYEAFTRQATQAA